MATTNYSLPTLESTALFDLVTDYNALANATDAALAKVAGLIPKQSITEMQGQISSLQTLTGSQGTQITTLQSQMSKANSNISTLQSGLVTTNRNIGALQTGLQTELQNVNAKIDDLNLYFTFESSTYTGNASFQNSTGTIFVMKNPDETVIKIWGDIKITGRTTELIPGLKWESGGKVYGVKSAFKLINRTLTGGYFLNYAGSKLSDDGTNLYQVNLAIGTDGYLYSNVTTSSTSITDKKRQLLYNIPYFLGTPVSAIQDIV